MFKRVVTSTSRHCPEDVLIKKERDEENPYHIHFGAGKLGMGLVLPAMVRKGVVQSCTLSDPYGS